EGWRRGLQLKFYNRIPSNSGFKPSYDRNPGRLISLSSNCQKHFFYLSRGDAVAYDAHKIAKNKTLTKYHLNKNKIPVIEGAHFNDTETDEEIITKADNLGYPVIIKPTNASLSRGV